MESAGYGWDRRVGCTAGCSETWGTERHGTIIYSSCYSHLTTSCHQLPRWACILVACVRIWIALPLCRCGEGARWWIDWRLTDWASGVRAGAGRSSESTSTSSSIPCAMSILGGADADDWRTTQGGRWISSSSGGQGTGQRRPVQARCRPEGGLGRLFLSVWYGEVGMAT